MLLYLFVACLLANSLSGLPAPQRRNGESPGKPAEKSFRSLDQVNYQDGIRARSAGPLKDSYGNPVTYDNLDDIDSEKPSRQADPNQFIIPGYASGILQPHEVPTRSFQPETSRKIDDDRIHFVDPLSNQFQNPNKNAQLPSPTLSTPNGGFGIDNSQTPINIPRPNIDLNETPQAPIDDPLNHQLNPPRDNSSPGAPSFSLEAPGASIAQLPLAQDLIPPSIPNQGDSVFIPRPNLDIGETPIDNSNGPGLNQGLLPPPASGSTFDNSLPSFTNIGHDGPVEITGDVLFAPKPSNGLLPPKESAQNDINFQQDLPTTPSTNKFSGSFGGSSGVLGGVIGNTINKVQEKFSGSFGGSIGAPGSSPLTPIGNSISKVQDKFTGSFGGSAGVLGGSQPTQIPVLVLQSPEPPRVVSEAPKQSVDKFQGSFGGPAGVLVSNEGGVAQPTIASPTVVTNKFGGNFGGASGILGEASLQATPTQTLPQLPSLNVNFPASPKSGESQRYTGNFGGSPGILSPFDNGQN